MGDMGGRHEKQEVGDEAPALEQGLATQRPGPATWLCVGMWWLVTKECAPAVATPCLYHSLIIRYWLHHAIMFARTNASLSTFQIERRSVLSRWWSC